MNKNKKNKKTKTNAEEKQVVSTSSVISEKLQGDIDELKNSYDSFLYVSKPFSSTNINNLQAKAKMYGLNPVPLKGARVLELGASCGGNIVLQALYYPETTFTGIDLSGVQVKHGNDIINSIGLKNVTLLEKDILDIDESFGTFDYIIVHGIWSWVPDVVKDKILSICNVNLSDNGIAYVSYNTYPGWKRLEQLRDIMLYSEKRAKDQDLLERTLYTKSVLKMVADTMNIDDRSRAQSAYKINNIHNVLNSNDYYVAHEYLEAFNDPVYVSDFIDRARKQGCAYIGDEVLQRSFITWLADDVTNNIRALSHDNYVDKEQFYDYVYDTQFRMSLLTKLSNEDKINHEETVTQDILNSLYYVGNSRNEKGIPEDWTDTVNIAIKELMDTHRQFNVQGIINHINSQYPGYNINMDQLYQRLLLLTIVGQINIFGESYPMTPFVENESYIPQRFINYVNTLIMKDGNKYMALGNMYNQLDNEVDNGVLYVMNQLAQPTSRAKLLELVESDLTVNRTTKDGYTYKVPSEQYLNEVLVHLEYLGYFTK
ncbi:MAG: class I SAM-dependent methyltransferase [Veillonella sp.]|uniref:class I SAM-dependent methyltransferase n=1 Tax=Veillonella sp. TaxID=1926307 RepID=UPI0028FE9AF7|nr:class I SAM-dependent methyltransferase [Veillonella sp.]MDU1939601.1 class I SAM-dependent methyltransferase [Veillonella sp.]